MRSTRKNTAPQEDLTTSARIRQAAIHCFGSLGFRRTTVRQIATEADVSPGLVIHHFGSKDGLREACDAHVLSTISSRVQDESSPSGLATVISSVLADPQDLAAEVAYLGRALAEGTPSALTFASGLSAETERAVRAGIAGGTVNNFEDPQAIAGILTMFSLAFFAMPDVLHHAMGEDLDAHGLLGRIGMPAMELFTHGYYTDTRFLDAARAALKPVHEPSKDTK